MKYSRLRTMALTFIIGLISVSFLSWPADQPNKPSVDLPKVELPQANSESPIVIEIYPTKRFPRHYGGGGGSGGRIVK